ncbi:MULTISPECIES: NADPH:quinone oxidoreductase family protein [Thalassospira]|uniref:Alcohol dehydrogenase zinc-binding domain-containing protein n=2 Tax=Thalassospira TaxID=168934 RepID=A0AB72UI33_9PROT|nr:MULTISPECIES: NADPH:quinone oxidoreductase family protein [Thalassospira]AJD53844.1 alcohol dehydrogenase zinc-binding domain-containing protein [Thalassospira xiamenensis M-5 = DSM 17429]KEO58933.1 NADPH:quinone oxidoreductase [Thalassospira permensis NBRC 106175]
MKAWICEAFGEAPMLIDCEEPIAQAHQIIIDIAACGVNFADTLILEGKYQKRPTGPFAPGFEIAGTVSAIGTNVQGFTIGDRVMALPDWGGYAGRISVDASLVTGLPENVEFNVAAAFQIAYGTSWFGLKYRANLLPGEVVLVHGAAGGVGLTAVECAKLLGATVIATAGGADKCAIAKAHGADHVIDYKSESIRARVKEICARIGRIGVDLVYDPVGGDVFDQSLRCVASGGRILLIGFASGSVPQIPANILLVKNVAALGFYFGAYLEQNPDIAKAGMAELLELLSSGEISPLVSATYPLINAMEALAAIRNRTATGKLVIRCRE